MTRELENWDEASASSWDVVVIGAGPAGIVTAQQLARHGARVLLLDRQRFPREKVCGGCLNRRALESLRELGFGEAVDSLQGRPLRRFELFAGGRTIQVDLPGGLAISRGRFDYALLNEAISSGVEFLSGVDTRVEPYDPSTKGRQLSCRSSNSSQPINASLVVLATGISAEPMVEDRQFAFAESKDSRIGVQISLDQSPDNFQTGVIYMAVGREGYVGLTRTEGESLNLAAAVDRSALKRSTAADACQRILKESGIAMPPVPLESSWKGTCGLTRRRHTAGDRLFVVGDAGSYVEPFTGEGMEMAVRSGRAVVPFVQRAMTRWEPSLKSEWSRQFDTLVTRRQWVCRGLSRLLRYPLLLRTACSVTSRFPALGRTVASMVT